MKKLLLAAAVATATLSTGAHALVTSSISSVELWIQDPTTLVYSPAQINCASTYNPGFVSAMALTGTDSSAVNFTGVTCLDIGGGSPYVALSFNLQGGAVTGPNGTSFTSGQIDIYTDFGTGWIYGGAVVASSSPINCVDNNPSPGSTVGLVWPATGTGTTSLPGAPNAGSSSTNAVCESVLLGNNARLYLTGTKSN